MKFAAALLVLALLLAPAARAEPAVGDTASPIIGIAGKQVPLPDGNWIVAGRAPGAVTSGGDLGSYGAIWNVVLFRIASDGALDAMAEINVNDMAVDDGWGIAANCQRSDLVLTVVRSRAGWDAACFFVTHTLWSSSDASPAAWRQARALALRRGLTLPATTVTAGFRVANRRDIIDVRFHFVVDPAQARSVDWNASPWSRGALQQDRGRLAFDRNVADWSAMMIGCIEAGLKNRLPATFAAPAPGAADAVLNRDGMLAAKQQALVSLQSSGLLSAEQVEQQSALLRQADAYDSHDAVDPGTIQFYRLLSYQGLSVTSDALVTFLWTAQSVQAAAVTLLQASVRTGRSYAMAYLWDWYGSAPTRPDIARTVDFSYGGRDH